MLSWLASLAVVAIGKDGSAYEMLESAGLCSTDVDPSW